MAPTSDAAPDAQALIARARKIIENGSPEQLDVLAVVGLRSHYRQQSREDAYRLLGALADALERTLEERDEARVRETHWHMMLKKAQGDQS